jgi:putative spermidine/putrescine transport system substrate-binding protein
MRRLVNIAIVVGILVPLLLSAAGCGKQKKSSDNQLVVVSYGGAYQYAQRKAYFQTFAAQYDIEVVEKTWSGDITELRAMVHSDSVAWDIVDLESYMELLCEREGLLEKIDATHLPKAELLPQSIREYGVASNYWSTVLGYNPRILGDSLPEPSSWADFWNVETFPGPRSLRDDPVATLEFALLGTGVPPDSLYPLDVDRALAALDKIKKYIPVWWVSGNEAPTMLSQGQVLYSSGWNGRFNDAHEAGLPVRIVWDEGLRTSQWWGIPKGAPHRDLAQTFIEFATTAGPQAEFSRQIAYGPVNYKALELLSAERLEVIPTSTMNLGKQILVNDVWWAENMDAVRKRWKEWREKKD